MFKKRCMRCDKKVSRGFDFCPYCGMPMKNQEDYGLLGKSDDIDELRNSKIGLGMPGIGFRGFSGNFMEKMFGNVFKMLEKEMRQLNEDESKINKIQNSGIPMRTNFQLFINGKRVNLPEFQSHIQGNNANQEHSKKNTPELSKIPEETLKKSSKLPRKEAKSKVQRFKDKVIYELETPGLNKIQNVLVNKLEDSIEIKVYTDKAVYIKTLPIKMPLAKYSIIPEEKLILEFRA